MYKRARRFPFAIREPIPLTRYHEIWTYSKQSPFLAAWQAIAEKSKPVDQALKELAAFIDPLLTKS